MIWQFTLHLKDTPEFSDVQADRLYGRCPDSIVSSSNGFSKIGFDRHAESLSVAIRTAVDFVRTERIELARVEIKEHDLEEIATW